MANNKDPEIKGTIGMDYDSTGADEAKADLKDTAAATEQAAQKSAAASVKDAEKQKQLAQMMRLTLMTKKELRAEILRLVSAQKAAASVKNAKAYEELTASINRAKEALEKLNTAQQVGMIAMQQQAQTGMQFAQGLGSMKTAAEQGAAGLATMATQAIALGMAIKAGLGPIGWVMAALQGLGMIVTHFTEKSKKEEEAIKATTKALQEQKKALDDLAAAEDKNAAAVEMADADDKVAALRKAGDKEMDALRDKNEKARAEREKGLLDQRKANEDQRKADAEAVRTGQMSPEEAAARERERNAKTAEAEKTAEAQAAAEEKKLLEKEKELAPKLLDERRKALRNLAGTMNEQDLAVVSVEDKALQQLVQRADEAKATEEQWRQKADEAYAVWDDDKNDENEKNWKRAEKVRAEAHTQRVLLEWELLKRTREQVDVLKANGQLQAKTKVGRAKEAVQIISGINAAQKGVEEQEAANKELDEKLDLLEQQLGLLEQEKAERKTAVEEAGKEAKAAAVSARLEKEWEEKQKEATPLRIKWLRENLSSLQENSQEWQRYNKQLQDEQETLLAEQWAVVQNEKSLEDQAVWLRAQLAQIQKGSKQWETYNKALHSVTESMVGKELSEMGETYKVAGQYAVEDKRTQYKILHKDREMLEARAKRLREMLGEEHDAGLREQITKALKENLEQQKGLTQATLANTRAARASLKGYQAPKFHDKNKFVEKNLNGLGKAYARHMKLAEKYAEQGNYKAAHRQNRMRLKIGERITGIRKEFGGQLKRDTDLLNASSKKEIAESKKRLGHQKKLTKDALKRNGEDSKKKKKPQERNPKKPKQEKPQKDPQGKQPRQEQQLADTKAALKSAQEALAKMSTKISDLAATTSSIATAAGQISKSAGSSIKKLKAQLKTMQTDINNLWKEVDA